MLTAAWDILAVNLGAGRSDLQPLDVWQLDPRPDTVFSLFKKTLGFVGLCRFSSNLRQNPPEPHQPSGPEPIGRLPGTLDINHREPLGHVAKFGVLGSNLEMDALIHLSSYVIVLICSANAQKINTCQRFSMVLSGGVGQMGFQFPRA